MFCAVHKLDSFVTIWVRQGILVGPRRMPQTDLNPPVAGMGWILRHPWPAVRQPLGGEPIRLTRDIPQPLGDVPGALFGQYLVAREPQGADGYAVGVTRYQHLARQLFQGPADDL